MDFKTSLDRYLTTPPDEMQASFDDFEQDVLEAFGAPFWDYWELAIMDEKGAISKWMKKLFEKEVNPKQAAAIIERAFWKYKIDERY